MSEPLTFERLHERGVALARWLDAGGSIDRLCRLDRRVRAGRCSDFPGRGAGAELRASAIPELDVPEADPEPPPGWRRALRCARCGRAVAGIGLVCGCWGDLDG
jgi:hypothetical protein